MAAGPEQEGIARPRRAFRLLVVLLGAALVASACQVGKGATLARSGGRVVRVVAAENFWGSIAAQLGGVHADVVSILSNPDVDPHSYEPTPQDARMIATAQMVVLNGIGYDTWASKLLAADRGSRAVIDVGRMLHLRRGANPHRWYDPADVEAVAAAITAGYARVDPPDVSYFQRQNTWFDQVALAPYHALIARIRSRFAGTPVGASESIFSLLAPALGLRVLTPYSFLRAVSEGTDVPAGDKSIIDHQITAHQIKIYVYNSQNTTPDVQVQLAECKAAGIPTATITETMVPPDTTFQAWQDRQLEGILAALEEGTAR